jgi:predicted DNA-binding protein (UPF0251 family)/predicted Fe-Mo cluster-binding NifX family protein
VDYFKPRGVPLAELVEVYLTVEGLEALRLADLEGLGQAEAAGRMGVSRHTFGRVLAEARRAVAQAVVRGHALRVAGGDFVVARERQTKEKDMAKIAVSSEGPGLTDRVDPRFGRAGGFVLVDSETGDTEYLDNGAAQARGQGAGIQAAETVAGAGAAVVLTGFVGPKAFQALDAAGVAVVQDLDGLTVSEALDRYRSGQAQPAQAPNRQAGGRR